MESENKELLAKVLKYEKAQGRLTKYVVYVGKWILLGLPILLVIITIMNLLWVNEVPNATKFVEQPPSYQVLTIIYLIILVIYFLNSIILLISSLKTKQSLKYRLKFEKKRGRPIESLDGFELLYDNVKRVLKIMDLTSIVCIFSVILFLSMLLIGNKDLGFVAMPSSLVGVGLALAIRSLNLNITDVNGLQDFFKPYIHQIFLDNYFSEVFSNHLDPISYLKWDEYQMNLKSILTSKFKQQIAKQEKDEFPITFAIERILFLYYLHYQEILSEEQFKKELGEVIDTDSDIFDLKEGVLIENSWCFSRKDIFNLFKFIKKYNSGFFTLMDRLQLELADNIERIAKDPIYCDTSCQETVTLNSELNLMVYLYNNSDDSRNYTVRVNAPGFEPKKLSLNIEVEGRGEFKIPNHDIPLISDGKEDIVSTLSSMLENGDTAWLTLEPIQKGEKTIQIFLENNEGEIIEGETRVVKVKTDIKSYLKKLSSLGSVVSGIAVALSRVAFS
ncbi:MAG: hypothetical protein EU541_07570 [Promethearchaeota archaeon]|nr:MAG: hypothetical protein EU541_07570 [Candidatus Lokiarchaeota archaeon]